MLELNSQILKVGNYFFYPHPEDVNYHNPFWRAELIT
jgi:hypothetical protein